MTRARWPALLLCLALCVPAAAHGTEATEQIRGTIDRGIAVLMRADLQGDARKQERRALLRKEIYPAFDFDEMSRRAMGVNWKARTPEERKEFIAVFKELLENSYASKIEGYKGEKIVYGKEALDLPYAEVRTKVVTSKGDEFSVNYRLRKSAAEWRIYDIVIEGASLVNNYRSQFTELLGKQSFAEMMERLRKTAKAASGG
ncbi:MAG: ABC transporter substrate-binding protein [Deltaproteobacteria bacterium]|nr:ABC transporter substrate-binding protein [Deltaproteobacteria bacterium]